MNKLAAYKMFAIGALMQNPYGLSGEDILKGMPHAPVKRTKTQSDLDAIQRASERRKKQNAKRAANIRKGIEGQKK